MAISNNLSSAQAGQRLLFLAECDLLVHGVVAGMQPDLEPALTQVAHYATETGRRHVVFHVKSVCATHKVRLGGKKKGATKSVSRFGIDDVPEQPMSLSRRSHPDPDPLQRTPAVKPNPFSVASYHALDSEEQVMTRIAGINRVIHIM
jgi:hypothetical protein